MPVYDPNDKSQQLRETAKYDEIEKREETPGKSASLDALLEIRRQKALENELQKLDGDMGETKKRNEENLATAIVTEAMKMSKDSAERAQRAIEVKEREAIALRQEADKAKVDMYKVVLDQITNMQAELVKQQREMAAGKSPRDANSVLEDAKNLLNLIKELTPKPEAPSRAPEDVSPTAITLEKMRQEHEREMKKLDIQLEQMRNDINIKLAEMADEKRWKERDWEASKDFKKSALGQLGDIASSVVAGFGNKGSGGSTPVSSRPTVQPPAESAAVRGMGKMPIEAPDISSFTCEKCGIEIGIPEGFTSGDILCPTPECGMKYRVSGS